MPKCFICEMTLSIERYIYICELILEHKYFGPLLCTTCENNNAPKLKKKKEPSC
jgi:hypothetical protein